MVGNHSEVFGSTDFSLFVDFPFSHYFKTAVIFTIAWLKIVIRPQRDSSKLVL